MIVIVRACTCVCVPHSVAPAFLHAIPTLLLLPLLLCGWLAGWLQVAYNDEGLEAVIFTADGDMRQALNNLQATHSGFGFVSQENVFKVGGGGARRWGVGGVAGGWLAGIGCNDAGRTTPHPCHTWCITCSCTAANPTTPRLLQGWGLSHPHPHPHPWPQPLPSVACLGRRAGPARQVCDQPHPLLVKKIIESCSKTQLDAAYTGMKVGQRLPGGAGVNGSMAACGRGGWQSPGLTRTCWPCCGGLGAQRPGGGGGEQEGGALVR